LSELGLGLAGGAEPTSGDYQQLMQQIQGRSDSNMIQTVMLRSLRQAMYQVENRGHFGLGYDAYTHFTSPIRRYPDLLVHRAIRSVVRSEVPTTHVRRAEGAMPIPTRQIYPYNANDMVVFGEQCSLTERRADEATRDVVSWLKCEYLRDQVGAVFAGHVSAVTGFGLFVELKDLYVDGLVHITALPHDYYRFEAAQHRLVGERTRKVFGLGDELTVRVVRVDLENRKIDFELESEAAVRRPKKSIVPIVVKKAEKKKARAAESAHTGEKKAASAAKKPVAKTAVNKSAGKAPTAKSPSGKSLTVKTSTAKKPAAKSSSAKSPAATKAEKIAAAKKVAESLVAPSKKAPTKASVEKAAVEIKPAAPKAASAKAKQSGEASNGDQSQKTSRAKAPAAVQQPAPPADSSFLGKAKAAVKKALGKSKSKD
jgi:ribonuclease R